jgi:hypothetical protein
MKEEVKKGYVFSKQKSLFGQGDIVGFGIKDFYIKEIDRKEANNIIKENHYSRKFYSASYIHLALFISGDILGVLQLGYAMNPASQNKVVANTQIDEYLELNRMWLSDNAPRNSESRAIAFSIKYIKRKYKKIKWIQSFADERCKKLGIVYQASNFQYYGEHIATFWEYEGIFYHNIIMTAKRGKAWSVGPTLQKNKHKAIKHDFRQFRYLYFIDKRCKKDVLLQERPYLKHYNGD